MQLTGELTTDRGDASGTGYWSPSLEAYVTDDSGCPGVVPDAVVLAQGADDILQTLAIAQETGVPVTPRSGKPVEIQALWYNALQFLSELELKFRESPRGYEKLAAIARHSFNEKFWNEHAQYLYDRIDGRDRDIDTVASYPIGASERDGSLSS